MLENADVVLAGSRIEAVGVDLAVERGARVVDGRGRIVLPGFVDLHTHAWQSLIRGCATDQELNGWLAECVLPLYGAPITGADAYAGARLSTLDSISAGITTMTDWSHAFNADFAFGNLRALDESGMRYVYVYGANADPATLEEIRRVKREVIDKDPLASLQIGSHPTTENYPNLAASEQLARELGVPLNIHLHESKADPATGQLEALRRAGALRPGLIANHAIHLTDAELDELAAAGVRVAHNPLSNMRLASGVIRLPDMEARGIAVGLGLDGGTNDTTDMFNVMRTAVGLQRATAADPTRYPRPEDALRMATLGGAEALGLADEIGSLTPGKRADLLVVDPQMLNFAPRGDWISQLVFNGQPTNVKWVFVNGIALKRNGTLTADTHQVIENAQHAADHVQELLDR
ncbi:amidohydrolase family protein [Actinokineospora fastidiosa]|uniref:N-ethylammeline chlorohydrolase n=1 Tax=Actinokineospora fastidiosa TaxID=1816 RepID=A0A918GHM7_9PSEU|nr:amidohydrolase family protein [Actinokineospora fastidiosa]GGS36392.1 N-ethylammeline chlorohydrolase [Actinokineospora fastidiosa]